MSLAHLCAAYITNIFHAIYNILSCTKRLILCSERYQVFLYRDWILLHAYRCFIDFYCIIISFFQFYGSIIYI